MTLVGCSRTELDRVDGPREYESTSDTTLRVQVQFNIELPELTPMSKALGETPTGDLTSMHIAVFGRSGYLKEYVEAQIQAPTANGKIGESTNRYTISATLALSENSERHIHFIGNGPDTMEYGQETDLIPNLLSPEGLGGYWQYVVVPGIKAKRNRDIYTADYLASHPDVDPDEFVINNGFFVLHDETAAYFADIPLIRNFSKIVVEDLAGCNFVTKSFAAVNVATEGSIAPYYSDGFIRNYQLQSYTDLKNVLKYPALLPLNAGFDNTAPPASSFENPRGRTDVAENIPASGNTPAVYGSVYMYERPVPDDDQKPTSVIIYGHFTDPDTEDGDDESGDYYYKVDLMDGSGYYPIYRNFKYRIQIQEILRPGALSPEDALRTMGSGDISADIATQSLTDISDGTSHILVSYMSKTLIHQYPHDTEQLTLLYKYVPDVDVDSNNDGEADWNNDLVANGGPVSITLQEIADNPIITGYSVADSDVNGFRAITITTSAPTGYLRTQYLQIKGTHTVTSTDSEGVTSTKTNALYRNVTFSMISTQIMTVTCSPSRLPKEIGEEITVNITIPKNLPSSMFPLVFNLEAENLSLTPDASKDNNNLPVYSGNSIYGTGKPAFHYIRTLSEDEYIRLSSTSTTTTVTIPCYFKTNKEESASAIRVIDEEGYFLPGNTEFRNMGMLYFSNLSFPNGVPKSTGSFTTFTFDFDTSDELPEKVYLKFENVRPTPTSGLSIITDTNDPHHGWYWYSPTGTNIADLLNGDPRRYSPIINLATTNATGIADVWIDSDEYDQEHLHYTVPATGISISPNTTQVLTLKVPGANTVDLAATVTPANSTDVVTWTSANTGIATEDENGHGTAVAVGTTTITATAGSVSASVSVQVRALNFSNQGFTLTDGGSTVTELPLGLKDVYFRFDYVSGYKYPVTFTLTGLTTQDNRLVDNHDGTFTFTPAQGDNSLTQYVHLKSTLRFSGVSANISQQYYDAVSNDTKSLTRPASFQIPQNAIYIRNASTGNPANFTTGSTSVYVNGSSARDYFASSTYSTSYLNSNAMTMTLSRFTIVDDDAPVYFWYRFYTNNSYYYADTSATLAELFDYIDGGQTYTLHFRIFVTGVTLNRTTANVAPGRTLNLVATVLPSGADDSSVSWSSSNSSVATVDNNGVVTVASNATVGSTATITVTTHEGGYTASCIVTVKRWAFTGGFSGTVLYGNGWPVTYTLTIPADDYEMPSGGIDIELALTNIIPDDSNITESGGKYYYHATSTGNKTLSFRTSGDRTGTVSVGLSHNDFNPATVTATRSYINIAAGKITNTAPEKGTYRNNRNTVNICTDENCTNVVASYTVNYITQNNTNSQTNYRAANFSSNPVDASKLLYFKMYSNNNQKYYYATLTAEELYNNGGNSTVTFSKQPPTKKEVTIETTSANYSTSSLSYTSDGITVAFSNLYEVQSDRLDMVNNSNVSISAPTGYHLETVQFNYYSSWGISYDPGSYSITNGGGSYNSGTWTASNKTTTSATIQMSGHDGVLGIGARRVAITSIVVVIEKN